jgi:hypothetical protein
MEYFLRLLIYRFQKGFNEKSRIKIFQGHLTGKTAGFTCQIINLITLKRLKIAIWKKGQIHNQFV